MHGSAHDSVVIVGAGHSGIEAAAALRLSGHDGPVTIIEAQAGEPYARPPLSKAFLAGTAMRTDVILRDDEFFARERIDLRTDTVAVDIDTTDHTIELGNGERLSYASLILATGSLPRTLRNPAIQVAPNALVLRTMQDAQQLQARFAPDARIVIVGGGYIGLEIASAARRAGLQVTVLEAAERVLARVTSAPVSAFFQRIHAEEGVTIITGAKAHDFLPDNSGNIVEVQLADGQTIPVDFVLLGVGVEPRTDLAARAGLQVDDGVVVDEYFRTSAPDVYAIGDVARHPCPQNGGSRRLESVPNAAEQARAVAKTIVGQPVPYTALPWFWSDQFDLKLQSVGLAIDVDDVVVRQYPDAPRRLAVFYCRRGRLVAADVVNSPGDFAMAKRLVAHQQSVAASQLADPDVSLKELAAALTR